jgi:AcrR family transcriptional regulator
MNTSPRTRSTRSRPALRRALLGLLETESLEQITVRDIASKANVGYATFFRHYVDKEELLHDLASDEIRRLLTMTLPIFYTADTLSSTRTLCSYVWENRVLWRVLLAGGASSILKEEYLKQALELVEVSEDRGSWLPHELAVTFAVGSLVDILSWWLRQKNPPPAKYMAEVVNKLSIDPIFNKG